MKKLQLKKDIVAWLGKPQLDSVLGGGSASVVTAEARQVIEETTVRQLLEDTSFACLSGPCHHSQLVQCLTHIC